MCPYLWPACKSRLERRRAESTPDHGKDPGACGTAEPSTRKQPGAAATRSASTPSARQSRPQQGGRDELHSRNEQSRAPGLILCK